MRKCPKCEAEMEAGWIREGETTVPLSWCRGEPVKSWTGATKRPESSETIPLTVYRCTHCGFIEFFA